MARWRRGHYGPPEGRFLSVSAGLRYACGLRVNGNALCWDYPWEPSGDYLLQAALIREDPAVIAAPEGRFLSVSAGIAHNEFFCGVREDRTALCWGNGEFDRTGRLDAPGGRFKSVSAGRQHACGVKEDRTVVCWGDNKHGRLDAPSGRFESVSAGYWFSCGIREDRTATCWGNNLKRDYNAPDGRFLSVSAGQSLACGVREDRTAVCWGPPTAGTFGELDAPDGLFSSVSAGPGTACGLRPGGALECWGQHALTWDSASFLGRPAIQAVYAVPAGEVAVAGREQLIADAVTETQAWFNAQSGGRHLLFRQDANHLSIITVKLSDRGDNRHHVAAQVYQSLGSRPPLLVFGEGDFAAAGSPRADGSHRSCAAAGSWVIMISLGRCTTEYPVNSLAFAWLVAHELVHMLGAAPDCAPHNWGDGHVFDSKLDILYIYSPIRPDLPPQDVLNQSVLDAGRDDYYGHGRDDCYDIADSPLLSPPAAEP